MLRDSAVNIFIKTVSLNPNTIRDRFYCFFHNTDRHVKRRRSISYITGTTHVLRKVVIVYFGGGVGGPTFHSTEAKVTCSGRTHQIIRIVQPVSAVKVLQVSLESVLATKVDSLVTLDRYNIVGTSFSLTSPLCPGRQVRSRRLRRWRGKGRRRGTRLCQCPLLAFSTFVHRSPGWTCRSWHIVCCRRRRRFRWRFMRLRVFTLSHERWCRYRLG